MDLYFKKVIIKGLGCVCVGIENKNKNPLFSFVMPFYNNSRYLQSAIESVLKSTITNFELVMVDDGSTDGSLDIVREYIKSEPRIKLYSHKVNKGPAQALKTCLLNSKGEYILFTAADDFSYNTRAEVCLEAFNKSEKIGIVLAEADIINEHSELTGEKYQVPATINNDNILIEQLKRNYCLGATMAIKKDSHIFGQDGFIEHSDDYEISLRFLEAGYDIEIVKESLVKYRVHSESASTNKVKLYNNTIKSLEKFNSEDFEKVLLVKKNGYADVNLSLGIFNLFRNNLLEAESYLRKTQLNELDKHHIFELNFYLSVLFYKKGLFKESYDSLSICKSLVSENTVVQNNLSVLEHYLNIANVENIIRELININKLSPHYLDAKYNLDILQSNKEEKLKFTERILTSNLIYRENYQVD